MSEDLGDKIIERLLNSYPCKICNKFKKYINEINGIWKFTGGYHLKDGDEMVNKIHGEYIDHLESTHLPTKQEWEILRKK